MRAREDRHIIVDVLNRDLLLQGCFAPSFGKRCGKTRGKTKTKPPCEGVGGCTFIGNFFYACTQIGTQMFWKMILKCYICSVNQIYKLLCR
ncbi:hypothetical protein EVA_03311 [gut metagenome]|uniref:Uncharacterized protein n=1 Tax=gut metagenome TaxID=749906 RepID=J9GM64_9ZZZZ